MNPSPTEIRPMVDPRNPEVATYLDKQFGAHRCQYGITAPPKGVLVAISVPLAVSIHPNNKGVKGVWPNSQYIPPGTYLVGGMEGSCVGQRWLQLHAPNTTLLDNKIIIDCCIGLPGYSAVDWRGVTKVLPAAK